MLDPSQIRLDFPLFQTPEWKDMVYLDNAATTQKPQVVIDGVSSYYQESNANVHRGLYPLAQKSSDLYEGARKKIADFLNAQDTSEIVFVRGVTEGINLVAHSFLGPRLKPADEILISAMEHHANLVPWQALAKQYQAHLKIIPLNKQGEIDREAFSAMLSPRVKMLALVHTSNSLGTINPVAELIAQAHAYQIPVLIDGAQSIVSESPDMQALDCDFFTFSGHKAFGPTGIGILYGKQEYLEAMEPYQLGGDMIRYVSFEETKYSKAPHKFEAGTPHLDGAVGLVAALDYIAQLGPKRIKEYYKHILRYTEEKMRSHTGLTIIGQASEKTAIISFLYREVHPHDLATVFSEAGIAIRAGHHCTMPLMQYYQIPGTARASFSIYNTEAEADHLVDTLKTVKALFG